MDEKELRIGDKVRVLQHSRYYRKEGMITKRSWSEGQQKWLYSVDLGANHRLLWQDELERILDGSEGRNE